MAHTLHTEASRALLTRREVRRLFRVNEITIDRWLDRGRLMQVDKIPDDTDGGETEVAIFAVRDVELIKKLRARLNSMESLELAVDRLPTETKRELLRQVAGSSEDDSVDDSPDDSVDDSEDDSVDDSPDDSVDDSEDDSEAGFPDDSAGQAADQPGDVESTREPESKPKASPKARKRVKSRKRRKKKRLATESPKKSRSMKSSRRRTADAWHEDEQDATPPERDPFATLQTAAEVSGYPELAEALWDEETLGVLHDAAQTLAVEAERLAYEEPATADPIPHEVVASEPTEEPMTPEQASEESTSQRVFDSEALDAEILDEEASCEENAPDEPSSSESLDEVVPREENADEDFLGEGFLGEVGTTDEVPSGESPDQVARDEEDTDEDFLDAGFLEEVEEVGATDEVPSEAPCDETVLDDVDADEDFLGDEPLDEMAPVEEYEQPPLKTAAEVEQFVEDTALETVDVPARVAVDVASQELEAAGIDLEVEEDRGPQVIDEANEPETWAVSRQDDVANERLLLQAELAEVKSLQQANLERMEARLGSIENLVEELCLSRAQDLNLESTLEEIRGNVIVTQSRRDILAASMSMISDSVQDLRTYVSTANKTALASAKSVQQLSENLAKRSALSPSGGGKRANSKATPVLVLGVGILVLTWTLLFYLKTGNIYLALAGVVVANIAGCTTILLGRPESE
ncbi:MAG: hypothetical protein ACYTGW_14755 [Planctomycetota bacterium]|jgi:hypothetical protein